jgi:hypothetical protein
VLPLSNTAIPTTESDACRGFDEQALAWFAEGDALAAQPAEPALRGAGPAVPPIGRLALGSIIVTLVALAWLVV